MKSNSFDNVYSLCYKSVVLAVLLLLSSGLYAADMNLRILPNQALKVSEGKYQLAKDFTTSLKQIRTKFVGNSYIKEDFQINEKDFQVFVFYNLKETAHWHQIYLVSWDGKTFARVY